MIIKTSVIAGISAIILASTGAFPRFPANAQPEHYGASALGQGRKNDTGAGRGDAIITVRSNDCRRLQKHVPAPDAAFQPGVTKSGRQVAPADIGPVTGFGNSEDMAFTFTVRLNYPVPGGTTGTGDILGEAPIGKVEFRNGVVSFNGLPLGDEQLQAVSAACLSALKRHDMGKNRQ